MTSHYVASQPDRSVYILSQKVSQDLACLTNELQRYSSASQPELEPLTLKNRASALIKDFNQVIDKLTSPEDLPRRVGLLEQREAVRRELRIAIERPRQNRQGQVRQDLETVYPSMPKAVAQRIAQENPQLKVYQMALQSPRCMIAEEAKYNVKQRHDRIQEIEELILLLVDLFDDVERAVDGGDPSIQEIDEHVNNVKEFAENGAKDLHSSVESARAARRKVWLFIAFCIISLLVVGAVVSLVVMLKK